MKRIVLAALLLSATACVSPVAPTYTCLTKPRAYVSPAGVVTYEVDHYEQATPCPAERID